MDVASYEGDELLSSKPGIGEGQGTRGDRTFQKGLDLETLTLAAGAPEHLTELRESSNFGDDDPIQRDPIGRQEELEKTAAQYRQRSGNVAGVELVRREAREIARVQGLAFAFDDGAKKLFLTGEVGIDGRLRHAGFPRDRIHADGTKAGGQERALCPGENAFGLGVRRRFCAEDVFHCARCGLRSGSAPQRMRTGLTAFSRASILAQE